jgi:diguanylate cyclase (GGDEF)-like protein
MVASVQEFAYEFPNIIIDLTTIGIAAVDARMNIILWNRFMEVHSNLKPSEVLGRNIFDCFPELPREWLEKKIKSVIVLRNSAFTSWQQRPYLFKFPNTRMITTDIPCMYQDCALWAILDKAGMVKGVCISVHDMTDTAEAQMLLQAATDQAVSLQETTRRDGLTGLYNRYYFDEQISSESAHARRYERPLSLVMIDIDLFKKINDSYGHQGGDEVLRVVAFKLLKTLRASDTLARYGGEEFALILPHLSKQESVAVAERLRRIIENEIIEFDGKKIRVTISMGVSEFAQGDTPDKLIKDADDALYLAKHEGRNRVKILPT